MLQSWRGTAVVKRKTVLFYSGVVLWTLFVAALTIYAFFPYQKALKIALQNIVGGSRMNISMEGVSLKSMGIKASKLLLLQEGGAGRQPAMELSKIDISWNPFSLVKGRLAVHSKATAYDGSFMCTVDGIPVAGPFNPNLFFKLENVNMEKYPQGSLSQVKGISGVLNGWLKKEVSLNNPERQTGTFQFTLKDGEIKEVQVKNMPRLIIPYKEIVMEGKIDGSRIDISKMSLNSDLVSVKGSGSIETAEFEPLIDLKLTYEALSERSPLKGKGTIVINGTQAAPIITLSEPQHEKGVTTR
jgi:type II secretion system protein N